MKAGGLTLLGGVVGGCATATRINPAVPVLAKVVQDSSQTRTTAATAGTSVPLSGVEPEDKPTFVPAADDPVAYSRADQFGVSIDHGTCQARKQLPFAHAASHVRREAVRFVHELTVVA